MTDITPNLILSCLNQLDFRIMPRTDSAVGEQGFYYNAELLRIEHWSELCDFNYPLLDHFSNEKGMINDGFLSVMAFDDIDHLIKNMNTWKNYLAVKLAN